VSVWRALVVVVVAGSLVGYGPAISTGAMSVRQGVPDSCSATPAPASAPSPALGARATMIGLSGSPFGVATTPDGRWSFVAELAATSRLGVFAESSFAPRLVRTIVMPGEAVGVALVGGGRYLFVANGVGATVVSVVRAETGAPHSVLGVLREPAKAERGGGGAIEVAGSPDGRYAFVSLEGTAQIAVYDLRAAVASQFRNPGYVGSVRVGQLPGGLAVSPDGRWLYATSEIAGARLPSPWSGYQGTHGTLSVISIARAERDPADAVVATVNAHCSPVRVAVSPDGSTVWVTARGDNELLAFSAAKLRSAPVQALVADVRVGEAPVGLAFVPLEHVVIVAESNRFNASGARSDLTVVDATAALAHRPAIRGTIRAGSFPREMSLEPDGRTLLVGKYGSRQLEVVNVSRLP
jgi:DNA-binding beta-propeller fold protein YncE